MYADDTTLLCSSSDPISLQSDLTSSLTSIANWFKVNKLTLNVKKTKLMIFGTNNILKKFENISLTYAKDFIDRVDSYKYLELCLIHVLRGVIISTVYPHVSLNGLV